MRPPAQVTCPECRKQLPKKLAVLFGGVPYHPVRCFEIALLRFKAAAERNLRELRR